MANFRHLPKGHNDCADIPADVSIHRKGAVFCGARHPQSTCDVISFCHHSHVNINSDDVIAVIKSTGFNFKVQYISLK